MLNKPCGDNGSLHTPNIAMGYQFDSETEVYGAYNTEQIKLSLSLGDCGSLV
jgi:hypothetical protein